MRRNCLYKYIEQNHPQRDVVVYEYGNPDEYLIHNAGMGCYTTHNKNTGEQVKNNNLLDIIWVNSNILMEYNQDGCIFLQVNYNK